MFLDTVSGGGQPVFGTTEKYKLSVSVSSSKTRRSSQVIHLSTAKLNYTRRIGLFVAARNGTRVDPGEFVYRDRTGLLTMTNSEVASGVTADPELSYGIPIGYIQAERIILTNIYQDAAVSE